jgi:hypothetical protein
MWARRACTINFRSTHDEPLLLEYCTVLEGWVSSDDDGILLCRTLYPIFEFTKRNGFRIRQASIYCNAWLASDTCHRQVPPPQTLNPRSSPLSCSHRMHRRRKPHVSAVRTPQGLLHLVRLAQTSQLEMVGSPKGVRSKSHVGVVEMMGW